MASHVYVADKQWIDYFCPADSELLVVPQLGGLVFGKSGQRTVALKEVPLIPRGLVFSVFFKMRYAVVLFAKTMVKSCP